VPSADFCTRLQAPEPPVSTPWPCPPVAS
jgi:hypothetical protein